MAIVLAALLPVFLLIVLGVVLKRTLMRLETQWHGLERLTYYVLFPMLLIQTLVKADLSKVPVAGVGGALLLSALLMSALCLALRPLLRVRRSTGRPSPRSSRARRAGRPMWRWRSPAICSARRAGARLGRDGGDHSAGQRVQRRGAGALCLAGKAIGAHHRDDRGAQSPDLGLRDRACHQRRPSAAAEDLA